MSNWSFKNLLIPTSSSNLFPVAFSIWLPGSQFLKPQTVEIPSILLRHLNHRKLCQLCLQITLIQSPISSLQGPTVTTSGPHDCHLLLEIHKSLSVGLSVSTLSRSGLLSIEQAEQSFFRLKSDPIILPLKNPPAAPQLTQPTCCF